MACTFSCNRRQPLARCVLLTTLVALPVAIAAPLRAAPPAGEGKVAVPSLFAPHKKYSTPKSEKSKPAASVVTPAAAATVAPATPQEPYVTRLDVVPNPGEDLEAAYYRYLSNHRVKPSVIRAKVRRLTEGAVDKQGVPDKERFLEVVAILRSALRTGQVQPWMYEALGLAMQVAGMPADEVERTLMSAADFADDPRHLIYIADYLQRFKLYDRALQMLQEVADRAPELTDAYVRGLDLGRRLENDDAIRWASLAILRRAWPAEQQSVRDTARRSALALLARMREQGQNQEADQFANQLKDASIRDVVIKVSWVGDADVDLFVEEPAGTVCSYRSPQTSNGGLLIGDVNSRLDRSAGDGYSEVYVCPEGFSGTYRALLRHVWGRIPAGKVKFEVWTNGGTMQQVYRHQVIPLDDDGQALVAFELNDGRRLDSLKQQQLAQDVNSQVAVNRAILAQQINAISSPQAIQAQQIANQAQQPFVIGQTPVPNGQGGVGFQPEVILLPIGATMSVNAVISADRRYVRITALPFFSQVNSVTQYNISTGITGIDVDLGMVGIDIDAPGGVPLPPQPQPVP